VAISPPSRAGEQLAVRVSAGGLPLLGAHLRLSADVCVCLLLQDLVQNCLRGGWGDMGGHVLREMTSRGLCGLGCPSRTSERGGEREIV
jgi:hypothetical protein